MPCSLVDMHRRFEKPFCVDRQGGSTLMRVRFPDRSLNFYLNVGRNVPEWVKCLSYTAAWRVKIWADSFECRTVAAKQTQNNNSNAGYSFHSAVIVSSMPQKSLTRAVCTYFFGEDLFAVLKFKTFVTFFTNAVCWT